MNYRETTSDLMSRTPERKSVGVVLLSRYMSSRLPGKALMSICGKKVLEIVTERLLQVVPKDLIVVATSNQKADNAISDWSFNQGLSCFRGDIDNVAERFYLAARSMSWEYAIRINGDNVFVDTELLSGLIALANGGKYEFISNVKGRTYPKGMSVEIVNVAYYGSQLDDIVSSVYHREHVTSYLYQLNSDRHYYAYNEIIPEAAGIQFALDTEEDLRRTEKIMQRFEREHWNYNLTEIFNIWKQIQHETSIQG